MGVSTGGPKLARNLKIWNGGGYGCRAQGCAEPDHAYVCAYSREDARRIIEEYTGWKPPVSLLRDYWAPCWGRAMDGIEQERGLWLEEGGVVRRVL